MARSTKRFWLVRHGLTKWNVQKRFMGQTDIPLSARGRVQAQWLARQLRHREIAAIYASDLARACETAQIIAAQRTPELPVHVSQAWRELNFGAWEGLTYTQIAAQYEDQLDFFSDPARNAPPGGESPAHLLRRVRAELLSIAQNLDWTAHGDIVIVSHSGALRMLLCDLLGIPLERQWQLRIDAGSLSALDVSLRHEAETLLVTLVLLNAHQLTTRF
ncbi:MAG TPA: histidine phosphatase family protein [Ktedonobacteraceae bacterium]|nr:histidine phosphatase family protein [Ktedonobacteraceae bacterium]